MTKIQAAIDICRNNGHCAFIACAECCLNIQECAGNDDTFNNIEAVRLSQARTFLYRFSEEELFEAAL